MRPALPSFFLERIRANPIGPTVPGSLPVLFFGDLFTATITTIGINPSRQEYLTPRGEELDEEARRFETLRSLGAPDRRVLTDAQALAAIERMRGYFGPGKPIYRWFGGLSRVMEGMGFSFSDGSAAHLDLVQEATDPVWSRLTGADKSEAVTISRRDLSFLRQQILEFPLRTVICTSARVTREVLRILDARTMASGTLARLTWTVAIAETLRGPVGVGSWNIPLARPTGLDRSGQRGLGQLLRAQLERAGVPMHDSPTSMA